MPLDVSASGLFSSWGGVALTPPMVLVASFDVSVDGEKGQGL